MVKPLTIGQITIYPPIIQAPLAGISDKSFRIINKRFGCPLVNTEMISDKALIYGSKETRRMLDISLYEEPVMVQIFGSDEINMGKAASMLVEFVNPPIIDINMGCPAPKVVKNGEGCALMKNLPMAKGIIKAVVKQAAQSHIPVTVKMRLGWSRDNKSALELAKICQEEGVSAITVHGRTRDEFYAGKADWISIGEVKASVRIPVIGNGDVKNCFDAFELMKVTDCDGIMIGRGCLGNPWIFQDLVAYFVKGKIAPVASCMEKLRIAKNHAELLVCDKGEMIAFREMRKHFSWYIRGMRGSSRIRENINRMSTMQDLDEIVRDILV